MRVFVGCSSEAAEYEDFVKEILETLKIEHINWRDSSDPSSYLLPNLLEVARECDGAILILTSDDVTRSRGSSGASPRDNVVLESGLFFAAKGLERVALVQFPDKDGNRPKLPSDFNGLQVINADPKRPTIFKKELLAWRDAMAINDKNILEYIERVIRTDKELETKNLDHRFLEIAKRCIIAPLIDELHSLNREEIRLSHSEYYSEIKRLFSEPEKIASIDAVSTLSSAVWTQDIDQRRYNDQNLSASLAGVKIRRLFVSSPADFLEFSRVFDAQSKAGISIKYLSVEASSGMSNLSDFVCFNLKDGCNIIFSSENSANRHVKNGKLTFLQGTQSDPRHRAFKSAWSIAYHPSEIESQLLGRKTSAPGEDMEIFSLPVQVITCQDAATAKGIELKNELKSLILETSDGIVVAHLQGDRRLSLRSVKNVLSVDEAYIASDELISQHGLVSGTVSAVLEPVWSFTHLIDKDIFDLSFVSTNAGELTKYFKFNPKEILQATKYHIAGISEL